MRRRDVQMLVTGVMALGLLAGCLGHDDAGPAGPTVTVQVAALNLVGVGDVVWDVEVVNGRQGTPEVVWQQRLASSRYGDGQGSVSYVGPCDATPGVHENTVRLWVVGVYADAVAEAGDFGEAPPAGPLTFENPTPYDVTTELWAAPLTHRVLCRENADSPVQFDVALMRPAGQGFFDIAVNFNDIFCSAKFDCCVENEAKTACASDIALLHDGDGERATTMVLGFACTAGPQAEVETELYLDALELDCTTPTPETFAADLVIDPSGALGNQCAVGQVGACAAATSPTTLDADAYLYQVAVYRGLELLTSEGAPGRKAYWNLALGVVRKGTEGGAVGIEDCRLRTRGTADDALGTSVVDGGVVAAGAVYPFIQWDVSLGSCQAEPLTFGDPTAMVRTAYTSTSAEEDTSFGYGFGPNLPAGRLAPEGMRYIPPGTFMMGSPEDELGRFAEEVRHEVTLTRGFYLQTTEVTQGQWKAMSGGVNPSQHTSGGDAFPVEMVDWYSAVAYANALSASQGLQACYALTNCADPADGWKDGEHSGCTGAAFVAAGLDCTGYRLPTEAEWEYAARAGTITATYAGDLLEPVNDCTTAQPALDGIAWWCGNNSPAGTKAGGQKAANDWGVYDMLGNVWEWTWDRFSALPAGPVTDPLPNPNAGAPQVYRGGRWSGTAQGARAAYRDSFAPFLRGSSLGFRLCRTVAP